MKNINKRIGINGKKVKKKVVQETFKKMIKEVEKNDFGSFVILTDECYSGAGDESDLLSLLSFFIGHLKDQVDKEKLEYSIKLGLESSDTEFDVKETINKIFEEVEDE